MEVADIAALAQTLVDEYQPLLLIDPYIKIKIEISDSVRISECKELEDPASWTLTLNPQGHTDLVDIQISVINGLLNVLFADLPLSKKRGEVISKLTHTIVQLTPSDGGVDDDEVAAESGFNAEV